MNQFRKGTAMLCPYTSMKKIFFAIILFCAACGTSVTPSTPPVVKVYVTAAAQPWLVDVSKCAAKSLAIVDNVIDPAQADIVIRVGEPDKLTTPAFQIDKEDLLIVTNRESPVQNLTADDVRALFAGQGQADAQIWVYSSGEDIQQVFMREIMQGAQVSSFARLAVSPQQMSDTLNAEKNAVGILGRHWKAGTVRDVFTLPDQPVLALTTTEPQGVIKEILACLQK
jgi:hypothetical protein